MCITPVHLPGGIEIPCRECWQCRENRTKDWVGRCIAESRSVVGTSAITLTYGRDEDGNEEHPRAKVLTYSDVQKWFKLLRKHGYPLRYFAVGEYGSRKGRSHWHVVVFWLAKVPAFAGVSDDGKWSLDHSTVFDAEPERRFLHQRLDGKGRPVEVNGKPALWWPHGWTQVYRDAGYGAVRYFTKYINKGMGDMERQGHLMMSKKPPLGSAYMRLEAERYVEAGLSPQDGFYKFHDVVDRWGRKVEFNLAGKTKEVFIDHFIETWWRRRAEGAHPAYRREAPLRWLPPSPWIEDYLARLDARAMGYDWDYERGEYVPPWKRPEVVPLVPKPTRDQLMATFGMALSRVKWDSTQAAWCFHAAHKVLYWVLNPATGKWTWRGLDGSL